MENFEGIKPFPAAAAIGHNRPPLDEQVVADFVEAVKADGLDKRIADIVASAGRCGEIDSDEKAGGAATLYKMAKAAAKAIEDKRESLNRPILNAQKALKSKADGMVASMLQQAETVRAKGDAYIAKKDREAREAAERAAEAERQRIAAERAAEAERLAAEQARLQAERIAAGEDEEPSLFDAPPPPAPEPEPEIEVQPAYTPTVITSADGTKIHMKTEWKHELLDVTALPDTILQHEKVLLAINQVIGQLVRGGMRDIPGTRIFQVQKTAVR